MFTVLVTDGTSRCLLQVIGDVGESILGNICQQQIGLKAKELAEWQKSGKKQHDHLMVQESLYKRLTFEIKKRKDEEGKDQLIVDKVIDPMFRDQNYGFLKRLELYESYLMD